MKTRRDIMTVFPLKTIRKTVRKASVALPAVFMLLTLVAVVATGCGTKAADTETAADRPSGLGSWTAEELVDLSTGETFTVADLKGTPVLLQTFAVW